MGSNGAACGDNGCSGKVAVYGRATAAAPFGLVTYLTDANDAGTSIGSAVALSSDASTALVGPQPGIGAPVLVYTYTVDGGWSGQTPLDQPATQQAAAQNYGQALAVSSDGSVGAFDMVFLQQ